MVAKSPWTTPQPRDGLAWVLLAWVLLAVSVACEVQRGGQLVLSEQRLETLDACPEPICPACPSLPPSAPGPAPLNAPNAPSAQSAAPTQAAPKVDLNAASQAELEALPGVGPATAQRILEQRQQRPFRAARDLLRVKGIGPAKYRQIEPHVTVGPPTQAAPPSQTPQAPASDPSPPPPSPR